MFICFVSITEMVSLKAQYHLFCVKTPLNPKQPTNPVKHSIACCVTCMTIQSLIYETDIAVVYTVRSTVKIGFRNI